MPETYEIRLVIERKGKALKAKWIDYGSQESKSFPLTLPLGKTEQDELRWYLEEYYQFPGAGDHVKAQKVEAKVKD